MSETKRNIARITKQQVDHIDVVIPAAGSGKRMKASKPKPMLVLGGRSLLQRQVTCIKQHLNYRNIVVVSGFKAEDIQEIPNDVSVTHNPEFATTNVVASLGIGMSVLNNLNKALIVFGDLAFDCDVELDKLTSGGSSLLINSSGTMGEDEIGCNIVDNDIKYMMWSFPNKWAQIAYLTGPELDMFAELVKRERYKKFFCFEIINTIIDMGGRFTPTYTDKNIIDIDTYKDLKRAKEMFNEGSGDS